MQKTCQQKGTLLFRVRADEPLSPFVIALTVETGRLTAGGGGGAEIGGAGDDATFWDASRVLGGGPGAGGGGGA